MAISIQTVRVSRVSLKATESSGSPQFITGDPRKEYQFSFLLLPPIKTNSNSTPTEDSVSGSSWSNLFSSFQLTYISSLAEQVNLPPSKITLGAVTLGVLQQYPFPKSYDTPTFSVVYLEDELESVYKFHKIWQSNISNGGILFEPLGTVCCRALYAPVKSVSLVSSELLSLVDSELSSSHSSSGNEDTPLGLDVFPFVFPSEIQRPVLNKGGQGVAKTTIVYTRVPDITGWNRQKHSPPNK